VDALGFPVYTRMPSTNKEGFTSFSVHMTSVYLSC
jgi:hypothetical protein